MPRTLFILTIPPTAPSAATTRFDGHGDCFIDFYAEPKPIVTVRQPNWLWHLGKVWFEKSWLYGTL